MFTIKVKDKSGTYNLQNDRDCCFVCEDCNFEASVTKDDIKNGKLVNPICPECGKEMKFHYWLDFLSPENKNND